MVSTKDSTKKLVAGFEKKYRKEKKRIWKAIALRLEKPRKNRKKVSVKKLGVLSKKFSGKKLVFVGKVLDGVLKEKVEVFAFEYSKKAKESIRKEKGKALSFFDLVEGKELPKNLVLVE